jgi:hypothetical protein
MNCFTHKHPLFILLAQIFGIQAITVPSQSCFWNCGMHTAVTACARLLSRYPHRYCHHMHTATAMVRAPLLSLYAHGYCHGTRTAAATVREPLLSRYEHRCHGTRTATVTVRAPLLSPYAHRYCYRMPTDTVTPITVYWN